MLRFTTAILVALLLLVNNAACQLSSSCPSLDCASCKAASCNWCKASSLYFPTLDDQACTSSSITSPNAAVAVSCQSSAVAATCPATPTCSDKLCNNCLLDSRCSWCTSGSDGVCMVKLSITSQLCAALLTGATIQSTCPVPTGFTQYPAVSAFGALDLSTQTVDGTLRTANVASEVRCAAICQAASLPWYTWWNSKAPAAKVNECYCRVSGFLRLAPSALVNGVSSGFWRSDPVTGDWSYEILSCWNALGTSTADSALGIDSPSLFTLSTATEAACAAACGNDALCNVYTYVAGESTCYGRLRPELLVNDTFATSGFLDGSSTDTWTSAWRKSAPISGCTDVCLNKLCDGSELATAANQCVVASSKGKCSFGGACNYEYSSGTVSTCPLTCKNNLCVEACTTAADCAAPACYTTTCPTATGICTRALIADGTTCTDKNATTEFDKCSKGVCVGVARSSCANKACVAPAEPCMQRTCDRTVSLCTTAVNTTKVGRLCTPITRDPLKINYRCTSAGACSGIADPCKSVTCTVGACYRNATCVRQADAQCSATACTTKCVNGGAKALNTACNTTLVPKNGLCNATSACVDSCLGVVATCGKTNECELATCTLGKCNKKPDKTSCSKGQCTAGVCVNPCLTSNGGCTGKGALCTPQANKTVGVCSCPTVNTFLLPDAKTCRVNFCAVQNGGCSQNCTLNATAAVCSCFKGYEVSPTNSSRCIDVNECVRKTSGCEQKCTNGNGTFTCSCNSGYTVDPKNPKKCLDVNECQTTALSGCQQVCKNLNGTFACSCRPGYIIAAADHKKCLDVCSAGVSGCQQVCNMGGALGFNCSCSTGFEVDSRNRSACSPVCNPACLNDGRCLGADKCLCGAEWSGATCSTPVCKSECLNGGSCAAPDTCVCDNSTWTGATCSEPVCKNACLNGGRCTAPGTCSCGDGWNGTTCSQPVCEAGCNNNGTCVAPNLCDCATGWTGNTTGCNTNVNECLTNKGGCAYRCIDTQGSRVCSCPPGSNLTSVTQCGPVDSCYNVTCLASACRVGQCSNGVCAPAQDGAACGASSECKAGACLAIIGTGSVPGGENAVDEPGTSGLSQGAWIGIGVAIAVCVLLLVVLLVVIIMVARRPNKSGDASELKPANPGAPPPAQVDVEWLDEDAERK